MKEIMIFNKILLAMDNKSISCLCILLKFSIYFLLEHNLQNDDFKIKGKQVIFFPAFWPTVFFQFSPYFT